jgi:acetyltransferase-like isoleucine patch superfamily enzyme
VPEIHGTGRIALGRNLYLYRDLYFETQREGSIRIGDNVVISRGVHIVSFARITIGENSMIGEYASIRDANHRFGDGVPIRNSGHTSAPIEIGANVWIGRGVTILPGIRIGDNAVIGANAVVTRDVAADTVAAGVPAHAIHRKVAAR